jgi:hypothetical protein
VELHGSDFYLCLDVDWSRKCAVLDESSSTFISPITVEVVIKKWAV